MGKESLKIYYSLLQGSWLSPTLFNIYTISLHGIVDQNTHLLQFADDFIFLSTHVDFEAANKNLQSKVNHFCNLLSYLNLPYNPEKQL